MKLYHNVTDTKGNYKGTLVVHLHLVLLRLLTLSTITLFIVVLGQYLK